MGHGVFVGTKKNGEWAILRYSQDDSKNKQQPRQMRGSLRSAAHDETVSGFGRDDGVMGLVEEGTRLLLDAGDVADGAAGGAGGEGGVGLQGLRDFAGAGCGLPCGGALRLGRFTLRLGIYSIGVGDAAGFHG